MTDDRTPGIAARNAREGSQRSLLNLTKIAPTLALLGILLLGFGLRLGRLGDQNIWWDEGHAIWAARQSLARVTEITAHDVHPPLYLWMLHGWLRVAGESEFAVRYLSLIGGMLTVALTSVVARRLVSRRAALLATLLLAMARFHIWWSQETRMYVWATFFALLSVYYMIRLRHGGAVDWWWYMLSSAAALYTLYLGVLVLLVENAFIALTVGRKPRRRRSILRWALAQLGILILYLPWLHIALTRTRTDTAKTSFSFARVWQLYGTVLATGISTDLDRYTWLVVLVGLLAAAAIALLFLDRRQPQRHGFAGWEIGLLLALPLVVPPLVIYGLSIPRGFFYSPKPEARYLLLFVPLFDILLAGGIVAWWQKGRWGRAVAVAAAILIGGTFVGVLPAYYAGRYMRDDLHSAMWTLAAYAEPGDAVLLVSGDRYPVFLYHYNRRFPDGEGPMVYLMPRHSTLFTVDNVEAELAPLAAQHERLWLASLERSLQDPDNVVASWLNAHRTPVLEVPQGYNYLRLYTDGQAEPTVRPGFQPQHPLAAPLGSGRLLGYDAPTTEFRPGDTIQLGLYVQTQQALELDVEWLDNRETSIAQQSLAVAATAGERCVRLRAALPVYTYTTAGPIWVEVRSSRGDAPVRLAAGRVEHSRSLPPPRIDHPRQAQIEEGRIEFLGYRSRPDGRVRAGETLTLELYWRAQDRLDQDYTVFVHLLGPYNPATGGPVWAQDDSYPLGGGHPTTRWQPGQIVADRHQLSIPENTPPGTFQVEIGLYDARTGTRLNVAGSEQDRILLDDIQINQN
jgi:4-amino-4-deoxy-L-arabinose transferase-like glycosyltransferase